MGDVCISISATDEVLNCKDTVASFATVLSGCLVSMADHKVTNHLMACHGHVGDINTHMHRQREIVLSYTLTIRLFGAEIPL